MFQRTIVLYEECMESVKDIWLDDIPAVLVKIISETIWPWCLFTG